MSNEKQNKKEAKEAHAYTPGLKVKRIETIQKIRSLPIPGKVLVQKDDYVDFRTRVAEVMMPGDPVIINASGKLGIQPADLVINMVKKEGDKVKKGENICGFNAFFGLWKNWVVSPADGVLENVSTVSGQITIREPSKPIVVEAYIPGRVIQVMEGDGAVVETKGAFIQGIFGIGGETHGEIEVLTETTKDHLTPDKITEDCKEKVLIGGSIVTLEAMRKAVEVGAAGIVVGGVRDVDLEEFIGTEIGVAITGQEEVGLTLIITEGFGEMAMNPRTLELFREFEGERVAMNGATQIRAGVLRPEIIIPHEKYDVDVDESDLEGGMKPGTPIRVIREPHFGSLGTVVSLPVELQILESESSVRVVEVELENGERVVIPRANIEIIEV